MRRVWLFFWIISGIFVFCMVFMVVFINPVVASYSQAKIEGMTVKAVNRAISQVVSAGAYRDFTVVTYGNGGKITSLSANMLLINGISNDIALISQGFLDLFSTQGIDIPIGTFSGMPVLTGKGPNVHLKVVPVGSVNCSFDSRFSGAGINQTSHRIMLKVKTTVNLIMPLGSRSVSAAIDVLLCESIIVGEVPEFMFPMFG